MTIKAAVFIGRFQPFHNGHLFALKTLLTKYDKVVVVIGSHNSLRTLKNPWTSDERKEMIVNSLDQSEQRRTYVIYQEDRSGNDSKWAKELKAGAELALWDFHQPHEIVLSGYKKDESSYYLGLFPQWKFEPVEQVIKVDATTVRSFYFTGAFELAWQLIPWNTYKELIRFKETNLYRELVATRAK